VMVAIIRNVHLCAMIAGRGEVGRLPPTHSA
jgi:hypothetical protein